MKDPFTTKEFLFIDKDEGSYYNQNVMVIEGLTSKVPSCFCQRNC